MPTPAKTVAALWAAFEADGLDAVLARVASDVVWQPDPEDGVVLRGADELRAYTAQRDCGLQVVEVEQHAHAVLATVELDGRPVYWVLHFRQGRFWRQSSFADRADAVASLVALQAIAGPLFGLREDAGVIRVRGELDVATAPSLEQLLLRSRERGERVLLDLQELEFMDSTGLRVLLRAQQAAERDGWTLELGPVSPTVQRLFDLAGVHSALPPVAR